MALMGCLAKTVRLFALNSVPAVWRTRVNFFSAYSLSAIMTTLVGVSSMTLPAIKKRDVVGPFSSMIGLGHKRLLNFRRLLCGSHLLDIDYVDLDPYMDKVLRENLYGINFEIDIPEIKSHWCDEMTYDQPQLKRFGAIRAKINRSSTFSRLPPRLQRFGSLV